MPLEVIWFVAIAIFAMVIGSTLFSGGFHQFKKDVNFADKVISGFLAILGALLLMTGFVILAVSIVKIGCAIVVAIW